MGLFKNEKSNWLGIIVNPVGYIMDHKPISEAAQKYHTAFPPKLAAETVTELNFKTYRQQWIDNCGSDVKSGDVGYSKANAAQACAAKFDNDPTIIALQDRLTTQAIAEKSQVQAATATNTKVIIGLIGGFLLIAILLYLFLSK